MSEIPFVDRKAPFNHLDDILKKEYKIILITSKKGIGKSRFVKEYFSKNHYEIVNCGQEITCKSKPFDFICNLIERLENKKGCIKIPSASLNIGVGPLSCGIDLEFQVRLSQAYQDIKKILRSLSYKLLIHIHNSQYIDYESLNIFKTISTEFSNVIFLFECNEENSSYYELIENLRKLEINYIEYKLNILKRDHIEELLKIAHFNKKDIIEDFYNEFNGNMHKLIVALYKNEYTKFEFPNNKSEVLLLYIIALSRDIISIEKLYNILKSNEITFMFFSSSSIKDILEDLTDMNLLRKINDTQYHLSEFYDDSMLKNDYQIFLEAQNLLINYHMSILKKDVFNYNSIYKLIYLFSLTNDSRINKIYKKLRQVLPLNQNNYTIIQKILEIINVNFKDDRFQYNLNVYELVIISLLCNQTALAIEYLEKIYNEKNICHRYLRGKILAAENKTENMQKIITMLKNESNPHVYVSLQLDFLTLIMKYKDATFVGNYVTKIFTYNLDENMMEFIFIKKNITIYKNNTLAIKELKECIDSFMNNKYFLQAYKAQITLGTRLTQAGYLEEAYNVYNDVLRRCVNYNINLGVLKNNIAVIKMLKHDNFMSIYNLLDEALIFIHTEYEQLLVKCNILILYLKQFETGDNQALIKAKKYTEYIEYNCEKYQFDEFLHIAYLCLYYFYSFNKVVEKAKCYNLKLKSLSESCRCRELKKYIQVFTENKKLEKKDKWFYFSKLKYRPAFVGYWESGLDLIYLDKQSTFDNII